MQSKHQSANYLLGKISHEHEPHKAFGNLVLSKSDAALLSELLEKDACSYCFNAITSFAAALHSLNKDYTGWATVKLYYSAFYACRGLLALRGLLFIYVPKPGSSAARHYTVNAKEGASPKIPKISNTHKNVCEISDSTPAVDFLHSQNIDGMSPLRWLSAQRDLAQYNGRSFLDPSLPDTLRFYDNKKIDQILSGYSSDSMHLYTFDPDHALTALPLRLLLELASRKQIFGERDLAIESLGLLRKRQSPNGRVVSALREAVDCFLEIPEPT